MMAAVTIDPKRCELDDSGCGYGINIGDRREDYNISSGSSGFCNQPDFSVRVRVLTVTSAIFH
jgi:hypothetical protein